MKAYIASFIGLISLQICSLAVAATANLTVLTTRPQAFIKPALEHYESTKNIKIRLISINENQLEQELNKYPQADLLIANSAQTLWQANQAGKLTPVVSESLGKQVPDHLKSMNMDWFGLTRRARVIVYNTDKVSDRDLFNYDGLASKMWRGRLCLPTAQHPDTIEFIADLLVHTDVSTVGEILHNWVINLAKPPFNEDAALIHAIHDGSCDVGMVDHATYIRTTIQNTSMKVKAFWPNQRSYGVIIRLSGAGILKQAQNTKGAIQLLEWLTDVDAQKVLTETSHEYPANPRTPWPASVMKLGTFREDDTAMSDVQNMRNTVERLIKAVGYK